MKSEPMPVYFELKNIEQQLSKLEQSVTTEINKGQMLAIGT